MRLNNVIHLKQHVRMVS